MHGVLKRLKEKRPESIRACVLLDKSGKREVEELNIHYIGFPSVPDRFLVGFGMDWKGHCRNWPMVAILKKDFYKSADDNDSG